MAAAPHAAILPWDTEFFGVTVARVDAADEGALAAGDAWCAANRVGVAYLQLDADAPTTVFTAAEGAGFRFVDVRVTLSLTRERFTTAGETPAPVRACTAADLPALERIASRAHTDSRFYADPRFPRERCDALYATWARRDCTDPSRRVLVADDQGDAVGYFTYALDGTSATIGLVGVDAAHRGQGLGAALVHAGLVAAFAEADLVRVATQGRNAGAQRLYQRAGMTTEHVGVWFHKWYAGGVAAGAARVS
jgi:dTDP-4-amino-4,6-dideoxy-D-galactose acyltransferase